MPFSRQFAGGCTLIVLLASISGCAAPELRFVRTPRDGRVVGNDCGIVYSANYQIDLAGFERLHPFDIHKYEHIYVNLVRSHAIEPADVWVPAEISKDDLLRVHSTAYLDSLRSPREVANCLEAPLVQWLLPGACERGILRPFRFATGGTLLAARLALQHGVAVNIGGGYHHAGPNAGGGFCLYADMPVAIRTLQAEGLIHRALVVDLDVHQGNGTALAVAADDNVFTFDMHEEDIYPHPKEKNDLDVPLAADTDDETYLKILTEHLSDVFDRARPDIVFLQAGVDVLYDDPLAGLQITIDGVIRRDQRVVHEARKRKIPFVMVLGGGYGKHAWLAQYRSIRAIIGVDPKTLPDTAGVR